MKKKQLLHELMMAQIKDLDCRLWVLEEERNVLINNQHTIRTVADILERDLNREARKKAELLAYLVYKHVHKCNPVKVPGPSRYSDSDLWIVRTAVKRIDEGVDSPAPPADRLSHEDWIRLCMEACV